ncbi:MAG: toxin HicA [Chloroflexi bacterium]|nr:toxin HicA [Chloroflexota bacterium]
MGTTGEVLRTLRSNPRGVRFAELVRICNRYFGEPRRRGTSHNVYRTPWQGDPRVNIQNDRGMAKPYQVRQVIRAIERLESMR